MLSIYLKKNEESIKYSCVVYFVTFINETSNVLVNWAICGRSFITTEQASLLSSFRDSISFLSCISRQLVIPYSFAIREVFMVKVYAYQHSCHDGSTLQYSIIYPLI